MTYWAPLRAGTPKLLAAGPDRNVTMPSLKVSCADAGAAKASVVAVTTDNSATERRIREKWSMISSPRLPAVRRAFFPRRLPGVGGFGASLGGLRPRVHSIENGGRPGPGRPGAKTFCPQCYQVCPKSEPRG